jgi:O-methyltransferase
MDELWSPQPAKIFAPLEEKERLYDIARDTIGDRLTYLEFGVHMGWSFTRILQRFLDPQASFFGFDSFSGLPEKWGDAMDAGHFSVGGRTPDIDDGRAKFIKGWFQNTVPGFLSENPISGPVLVHFDADLYSSTLFLLTTLWHHIPEYWFIFDEFQPDEIIAMYDFVKSYPVSFEFVACTKDEYERPQQVFGKLKRIPMVV